MVNSLGNNVFALWILGGAFGIVFVASSPDITRHRDHERLKREVTCEERFKITSDHTRCLQPSSYATDLGGVSPEEIEMIVNLHNTVRAAVSPTATNMQKMSWDDSLAVTATRWAFACADGHDNSYKRYDFGRFSVGQNLASSSNNMGWEQAITLWADEKKYFVYGANSFAGVVGHYTQMIWADTAKVGCGLASCSNKLYKYNYVCNYGPAGNLGSQIPTPYKNGEQCSECRSTCRDGLCDCGDKVCLNGGTMDLNTCECRCSHTFQVQPNCGVNCTDIENQESRSCPSFGVSGCEMYSNVPEDCPHLCSVCPSADYRNFETEPSSSSRKMSYSSTPFYFICSLYLLVMSVL